jgi:hypothetical protein
MKQLYIFFKENNKWCYKIFVDGSNIFGFSFIVLATNDEANIELEKLNGAKIEERTT